MSAASIDALMAQREAAVFASVDALLDEKGCKGIDAFKLVKRFEQKARRSLPEVRQDAQ